MLYCLRLGWARSTGAAYDYSCRLVYVCIGQTVTTMSSAKTAVLVEISFGMWTELCPGNYATWKHGLLQERGILYWHQTAYCTV